MDLISLSWGRGRFHFLRSLPDACGSQEGSGQAGAERTVCRTCVGLWHRLLGLLLRLLCLPYQVTKIAGLLSSLPAQAWDVHLTCLPFQSKS